MSVVLLTLAATILVGCGATPTPVPRPETEVERLDRARRDAARFLIRQQAVDGAWRSDQYAPFKDGSALTPLALDALRPFARDPEFATAYDRGCDFLASLVKSDGTIEEGKFGLSYPVYTAALTAMVLKESDSAEHRQARKAWLAFLRRRQLSEDLGWTREDKAYGGWGYSVPLPRKPKPGALTLPVEANLSATVFALDALRDADDPANEAIFARAAIFLARRQNYERRSDSETGDGGFTFIYDDGARNKAGPDGEGGFRSYGSTTADGLRGLRACGLTAQDPRVLAAQRWLTERFRADAHPGDYGKEREPLRDSVYFYYCRSVATTLRQGEASKDKLRALAQALIARQDAKGGWVNAAGAQREDDPLVATSFALAALNECRGRD